MATPGSSAGVSGSGQSFSDVTQGLTDLTNLFISRTGKSSGTQVTKMDEEGMMRILTRLLESTEGMAATAGLERSAGLFDSSTGALLMNDLIARAVGEAASRNIITTTTTKTKQDAPFSKIGGKIEDALKGGAALLGPVGSKLGIKF